MAYGKIRIVPIKETVSMFNVFLDDINISKYTHDIRIKMPAGQIPEVWVQLVGIVEIPENITAYINAEKQDVA